MRQGGRHLMLELLARARAYRTSMHAATARAWERVSADDRRRVRNHAIAVASVAAATGPPSPSRRPQRVRRCSQTW